MRRRKKNVLDSSDEDSNDSDNAARSNKKVKATARKRGKAPATTKRKVQRLQDDSDDDGSTRPNSPQNGQSNRDDNSSISDCSVSSSAATNKKKGTTKAQGRPSRIKKKAAQTLQDDSDSGGSTRPNTPKNANNDSSDSDYVADSTSRPKRRLGMPSPALNNKRYRFLNGSVRDTSPQPSTSQNGISETVLASESDSDTSEDSDCGPVNERNFAKKKTPAQRSRRVTRSPRAAKKKVNYAASKNSGRPSQNSSQLNASQKKGSKLSQTLEVSMDPNLVENLAQKLVYFLLIENQKKYAIRRKSIVTHVFRDDYSPKLYTAVIMKANTIFKKIYGMELIVLENQKDSYLIVNILSRDLNIHDYVDLPRIKQQQHALLIFLLTVIFMNENVITEDDLTRCLKPLGIDLTSNRIHPVFGDVKKYITTELVKQMYLNYECISKEPPKYEFTWGLRAKQEVDKRELLQFTCNIMDDTSPEDWRIQFRDAEAS